jgi:hypothetical protein
MLRVYVLNYWFGSRMLKELLIKKKSSIIDSWIQLIFESYPAGTSEFLKSQNDRFSNPVGHIITESAVKLFDVIIDGSNIGKIKLILIDVIKLRAVQDFLPSKAADIIFSLKRVLYKKLEKEINEEKLFSEFIKLDSQLDSIALAAFDLYMESREKVFQIRVNEIKSGLTQKTTG